MGAAIIAFAASPALADVKAGVDAWTKGDYRAAVREWEPAAAAGDADAEFNLGQAYKAGKGVPQDAAKAEDYFRRAAQKGHPYASDNYGITLFQTGRPAEAMPWLQGSADRGEPRAMYIIGVAAFNGDYTPKDWVRAYALMTRAAQAGVAPARDSLATMDSVIPLEQRQMGISLAAQMTQKAEQARTTEFAAVNLGVPQNAAPVAPANGRGVPAPLPTTALPPSRVATSSAPVADAGPVTAGADYANPVPVMRPAKPAGVAHRNPQATHATADAAAATAAAAITARPAGVHPEPVAAAPRAQPRPATAASGAWRIQLGAFSQPANADALWNRVKGRPEVAGHGRVDLGNGGVRRLLAGGYASADQAGRACTALKAGGFACMVIKP